MKNLIIVFACLFSVSVFGQGACNNQTSVTHQGYEYDIVEIGDQCWFAENCRYLPKVSPSSEGSETSPYYYVYGYGGSDVTAAKSKKNYETYGVLYNRPAVMTEGVCPSGWHIPSDGEFFQLTDFLDGEIVRETFEVVGSTGNKYIVTKSGNSLTCDCPHGNNGVICKHTKQIGTELTPNMDPSLQTEASQFPRARGNNVTPGYPMKSTSGWDDGGNGSNSSGFTGLPGGYLRFEVGEPKRNNWSQFGMEGSGGGWWLLEANVWPNWCGLYSSNTLRGFGNALQKSAKHHVAMNSFPHSFGFSARCVRD